MNTPPQDAAPLDDLATPGMCVRCFEIVEGFEPDMGDDVTWTPGTCQICGSTIGLTFEVT